MNDHRTNSALVMIPDHLLTTKLWKVQVHYLQSHCSCVLVEIPEAETIRQMAESILDQVSEKFYLAGLSMGGIIAFEILRIAPERVLKLANLDTSPMSESPER